MEERVPEIRPKMRGTVRVFKEEIPVNWQTTKTVRMAITVVTVVTMLRLRT